MPIIKVTCNIYRAKNFALVLDWLAKLAQVYEHQKLGVVCVCVVWWCNLIKKSFVLMWCGGVV